MQNLDLTDNHGLRVRHPTIHQLSYDGEISFMISRPEDECSQNIRDQGAMITERADQEYFRSIFLNLFPENNFKKVQLSKFLILQRPLVFGPDGKGLDNDWFCQNSFKRTEENPEHIYVVMPLEWAEDSDAVERFLARMARIEERNPDNRDQPFKALAAPVFSKRNPSIGNIRKNFPNTSKNICTPGTGKPQITETFEEVNFPITNDLLTPQGQGQMGKRK